MGFWESAVDQAGRQYGARYWRWFAFARVVGRVGPGVGVILVVSAVATGAYLAYRWLRPDWAGVGHALGDFAGTAAWWVGGVLALGLVVTAGVLLWRVHGWKLRLRWGRF